MTHQELVRFCKKHDVEVSFRYDPAFEGCTIAMRRGLYQIRDMLSTEQIETSKELDAYVQLIFQDMLNKINNETKIIDV